MRKATAYLARHAASTARLRLVLTRAVLRDHRGEDEPDESTIAALVEPVIARLKQAGVLDDTAFARGRAARLAATGRPAATIRVALRHRDGIAADDDPVLADSLSALDPETQARRWAQRRRLGPFRPRERTARRDADIASLMRAGFPLSVARAVIDADDRDGAPLDHA